MYGVITQPSHYHDFADQRSGLGIPHVMDVLSNVPFLFVGMWGYMLVSRRATSDGARSAWQVFFIAVALTCFGSSYYHWAPDDLRLLIDRLPIAWACMALSCALLAERIDARCGELMPLFVSLFAATLATVYWYLSHRITGGLGDLRAYLFVQFLPMVLVPLCLYFSQPKNSAYVSGKQWFAVLGLYALAKGFEVLDHRVLDITQQLISGHTLKHLIAAGAAFYLAYALSIARR
jgi:Ceramidase